MNNNLLPKYFKCNFVLKNYDGVPRTSIWIYKWHLKIYYPVKFKFIPYFAIYIFPQFKYFKPYLITEDFADDIFENSEMHKNIGLGICFWHKGHICRIAIRLNKNSSADKFIKAWERLQQAIKNPEALESKAAFDYNVLVGNEIVLEEEKNV